MNSNLIIELNEQERRDLKEFIQNNKDYHFRNCEVINEGKRKGQYKFEEDENSCNFISNLENIL